MEEKGWSQALSDPGVCGQAKLTSPRHWLGTTNNIWDSSSPWKWCIRTHWHMTVGKLVPSTWAAAGRRLSVILHPVCEAGEQSRRRDFPRFHPQLYSALPCLPLPASPAASAPSLEPCLTLRTPEAPGWAGIPAGVAWPPILPDAWRLSLSPTLDHAVLPKAAQAQRVPGKHPTGAEP